MRGNHRERVTTSPVVARVGTISALSILEGDCGVFPRAQLVVPTRPCFAEA